MRGYFRVRKKDPPLIQFETIIAKAVAKCLKIQEKQEQEAKAGVKIPVALALHAFEITGLQPISNLKVFTPPHYNIKNRVYYRANKDQACALGAICVALRASFLEDNLGAWNDREVVAFLHRMSDYQDLELDVSTAKNITTSYLWGYTFAFDGKSISETSGWSQSLSKEYAQGFQDGKAALEALGDQVEIYDDLAAEIEEGYYEQEDLEWVKRPAPNLYGRETSDSGGIHEHIVVARSVTVEEQQANLARAFEDFKERQIKASGLESLSMERIKRLISRSISQGENLDFSEQLLLEMEDLFADASRRGGLFTWKED